MTSPLGLIVDGAVEDAGITCINAFHDPRLALLAGHSKRPRHTRWVRSIVLHNTKNIPVVVKPGVGPSRDVGVRVAKFWSTNPEPAGAHLVVDWDGTIYCMCDLLLDAAYHAGSMNEVSIGIEIFEDAAGIMYEAQIRAVVILVEWLCRRFRIQRQMHDRVSLSGGLPERIVPRIVQGGADCVGVFGHSHQSTHKAYDPSNPVFDALAEAGFKELNFAAPSALCGKQRDSALWVPVQKALGVRPDGVPGPVTCDALQAHGYEHGLYDFGGVVR